MPFVEQEQGFEDKVIDGKTVKVYKPRMWLIIFIYRTYATSFSKFIAMVLSPTIVVLKHLKRTI